MEETEQPRKIGGLLVLVAVLAVVAAIWGAVALASGSGSSTAGSGTTPSTSQPAGSSFTGSQTIASTTGSDRHCPGDGRSANTHASPSTSTTVDGSTNPTP